jgi:hypothetical protein
LIPSCIVASRNAGAITTMDTAIAPELPESTFSVP